MAEVQPMSWFPDLARESMVAKGEHVRTVGWLDSNQPYTRGTVPPEFVARLQEFVELANESSDALWFGVFGGVHTCEFCRQHHDSRNFGVPAGELLYVAPAMIGHYVEQHGYAPPAEFIAAVAASPLPSTEEYARLAEAFARLTRLMWDHRDQERVEDADGPPSRAAERRPCELPRLASSATARWRFANASGRAYRALNQALQQTAAAGRLSQDQCSNDPRRG